MKLENKKETYRVWLQKFIATVMFTPLVLVFSFSNYFDEPFIGLQRPHLIIIITVLYLSVIIYHHILNPYFLFYSDHKEKLIFRYYPVRAFNQKKHTIIIPKDKFLKYETERTLLGEKLYLFQKGRKGIAKYPPISLSGLGGSDRQKLKDSLDQYFSK